MQKQITIYQNYLKLQKEVDDFEQEFNKAYTLYCQERDQYAPSTHRVFFCQSTFLFHSFIHNIEEELYHMKDFLGYLKDPKYIQNIVDKGELIRKEDKVLFDKQEELVSRFRFNNPQISSSSTEILQHLKTIPHNLDYPDRPEPFDRQEFWLKASHVRDHISEFHLQLQKLIHSREKTLLKYIDHMAGYKTYDNIKEFRVVFEQSDENIMSIEIGKVDYDDVIEIPGNEIPTSFLSDYEVFVEQLEESILQKKVQEQKITEQQVQEDLHWQKILGPSTDYLQQLLEENKEKEYQLFLQLKDKYEGEQDG